MVRHHAVLTAIRLGGNTPPVDDFDAPLHVRFHVRTDCPRISDAGNLRRVDKPYSATHCALCASELSDPTSPSVPAWAGHAIAV